jgi:lipopolysaccharide/colanic/teichoic acid biosynthesis glycosyltransferase
MSTDTTAPPSATPGAPANGQPGASPAAGGRPSRLILMDELYARYGKGTSNLKSRLRFWRKKYMWILVVGGAKAVKRFIDIVVSILMLVLLTPLFLVVALLVKRDGGPALFWQVRVGRWGREFPFPKFRSMVINAPEITRQMQAALGTGVRLPKPGEMKGRDPRLTRIGKWIRKLSIDELPQLWCVLKGDMSLVGPRPPVPSEVAKYTLSDRRRLDVVPGLTCIWQVSGRSHIAFPQQVKLDEKYIQNQSLWLDFKILLQTIPAVLLGKGAF